MTSWGSLSSLQTCSGLILNAGPLAAGYTLSIPFVQPLPGKGSELNRLLRWRILNIPASHALRISPQKDTSLGRFAQAMPREADPKFKGMDNQGSTLSAPAVLGDAFDFTQEQVPIRWRSGAKKGAQAPAFDGNSNSEASG